MILAKISFSALNLEIYTEGLEKPLFWSFLSESRCGGFPAGLRLPHLWRTPQCIKHVYQLVNAPSAQCTLVHGCLIAPLLCWCLALVFFALNIDTGRVLYIVSLSFFMPLTIYQLFTDRLWRYRVLQRVHTFFSMFDLYCIIWWCDVWCLSSQLCNAWGAILSEVASLNMSFRNSLISLCFSK